MLAVFRKDTNQVKSSPKAQQQGKTNYCLAAGVRGGGTLSIFLIHYWMNRGDETDLP